MRAGVGKHHPSAAREKALRFWGQGSGFFARYRLFSFIERSLFCEDVQILVSLDRNVPHL
jgi:hypothetical protein